MRRGGFSIRNFTVLGAVLILSGVVTLIGVSAVSAAKAPVLTFTPNTNIGLNQGVLVSAKGFTRKTRGGLSQCNITPGEPVIRDVTTGQPEPVGCQPFVPIKTSKKGGLHNPTGFGIQAGQNGPPDSGTDSAGTDASTDAMNYSCPPTAAQIASGGECEVVFTDVDGQTASEIIDYDFESTTTTTAPPPAGCTPVPTTGTGGTAIVTVTPGTCLTEDEKVTVTGTGLAPSSVGSILECNGDPSAPTVMDSLTGTGLSVGCTSPALGITASNSTDASGHLNSSWIALTGTIGPPDSGTDSSGGSAAADAANYPCPPTPAQYAGGVTCFLEYGDLARDRVLIPLSFGASPCRDVTDGELSGNTTVTSATALFTSTDDGSSITGVDIPTGTTITSVTSSSQATMSAPATGSAANVSLTICQ